MSKRPWERQRTRAAISLTDRMRELPGCDGVTIKYCWILGDAFPAGHSDLWHEWQGPAYYLLEYDGGTLIDGVALGVDAPQARAKVDRAVRRYWREVRKSHRARLTAGDKPTFQEVMSTILNIATSVLTVASGVKELVK